VGCRSSHLSHWLHSRKKCIVVTTFHLIRKRFCISRSSPSFSTVKKGKYEVALKLAFYSTCRVCECFTRAHLGLLFAVGHTGYFRKECCCNCRPVATPGVKVPSHPFINFKHEPGQNTSTVYQVLGVTRPGIEPSLPDLTKTRQS